MSKRNETSRYFSRTQKILVPAGTINPDEDTIIEIPIEYMGAEMVVARSPDRSYASYRSRHETSYSGYQNKFEDDEIPWTRPKSPKRSRKIPKYEDDKEIPTSSSRSNKSVGLDESFKPSQRSSFRETTTSFSRSNKPVSLEESFQPSHHSSFRTDNDTSLVYETAVDLDQTEIEEKSMLQKKLADFQQARREFLMETTGLATATSHKTLSEPSFSKDCCTGKPRATQSFSQRSRLDDED